jgi:predicted nucleotidyltransferase component of viral defense system
MFYNILDKQRLDILPFLRNFKEDFYLAGGTGLALQLGHRDSIDFDFFSKEDINTESLFKKISSIFIEHDIKKIQDEKNTLTILIDGNIKISFFTYHYPLIGDLVEDENFKIANLIDIAAMKMSAITSRATNKDYIDLYFIMKHVSLTDILLAVSRKMKSLDINLVLKSLVYFDDIEYEPINFKNDEEIEMEKIKKFFISETKKINT